MPDLRDQRPRPPEVPGQLSLFHACPVCDVNRVALGAYIASTRDEQSGSLHAPYDVEDLLAHLMWCDTGDEGIGFHDEVEPF